MMYKILSTGSIEDEKIILENYNRIKNKLCHLVPGNDVRVIVMETTEPYVVQGFNSENIFLVLDYAPIHLIYNSFSIKVLIGNKVCYFHKRRVNQIRVIEEE